VYVFEKDQRMEINQPVKNSSKPFKGKQLTKVNVKNGCVYVYYCNIACLGHFITILAAAIAQDVNIRCFFARVFFERVHV